MTTAAAPFMAAAAAAAAAATGPAMAAGGRREAEARARQAALWGRARSLCRRLRALQARQVERHVRQQLAGLARGVGRPPPDPSALGSELKQLAARATARLRAAQRACDSDATDSSASSASSSARSASSDSEGPEPPPALPPPPRPVALGRHLAECQWAMERAAIICRWTWLQAQVSDLEYRIRQQTDVYKQLRTSKGPVVLGDLQREDVTKQPNRLGSAGVVNSRSNKVLSPPSDMKVPAGDRQCGLPPHMPSYLLQNTERQNSRLAQSLRNLVCPSPSCTHINGAPEPPKACPSPHQVNGISNCFNPCSTKSSFQDDADAGRILNKPKQLNSSRPAAPSPLDNGCVAARIRPVCRYRKRRLVRVSTVSHLSRKPQKPLTQRCNCEHPASCILCDWKASVQTTDPETVSLEERVALLDSGFHPVLSFSHGRPLHLHFEALLREDHRLRHKLKTLRMPQWGMKDFTSHGSSSLSASGSLLKGSASHSLLVPSSQTPKSSHLHHLSSVCLENTSVPPFNQVPGHSVVAGSSTWPAKKKKVESSYDINNIVIPVSMAAATRVEKLQYKEILTPSWRMVDPRDLGASGEAGPELEDTSDEAYLTHHQMFEELERSRWDSWAVATSHRRGNRVSHRAGSRCLPQLGSRDALSHHLHRLPPTGSLSPALFDILQPLLIRGRNRGGLSFSEDTSFSLPEIEDDVQNVHPWERRTFPLPDTEYQALQEPPCEAAGKQTRAVQQWDSGQSQDSRTNQMNSGLPHPEESLASVWQGQSDGGSGHREDVASQHCLTPRLISNR